VPFVALLRLLPACCLFAPGCRTGPPPEATSLLGEPLSAPTLPEDVAAARQADLAAAEAALAEAPDDADALIWVARRQGYLGRFRAAVGTLSRGIERHPRDARFYRHRGHRWITLRELGRAVWDLERAVLLMRAQSDAIEPDGQPNARNQPTGSLYFNVYYHLALAHYLAADFARAADVWARCQQVARTPDALVATTYWRYLTLRRLGRHQEAGALLGPVRRSLDVIENHAYLALLRAFDAGAPDERLLAGRTENDAATYGNGVATWLWLNGEHERARRLWRQVVATSPWPAFGHVAAEAALARRD
jgi:tetratricopeptide (TPR) repeat protein